MAKKFKISQEDLDAFYKAVKGTKPLVKKKIRLSPGKSHSQPSPSKDLSETLLRLNETLEVAEVKSEEWIVYKQAGISNKTLRKLRKGQYNVEAKLDLHGMSTDEAKKAVNDFLQHCLRKRFRIVLIIHGKGHHSQTPVLKNKLNLWLREIDVVLAFCSATPTHGSRGAMYVLLKRSVEETQK